MAYSNISLKQEFSLLQTLTLNLRLGKFIQWFFNEINLQQHWKNPDVTDEVKPVPVRSCEHKKGASLEDVRGLQIFPTAPPGMPFQLLWEFLAYSDISLKQELPLTLELILDKVILLIFSILICNSPEKIQMRWRRWSIGYIPSITSPISPSMTQVLFRLLNITLVSLAEEVTDSTSDSLWAQACG